MLAPVLLATLLMPQIDYLPPVKRAAVDAFFNFPPGMSPERVNREIAPVVLERMRPYMEGEKGPQLASDVIAQAFWKETGVELGRVGKGQASRLSATGDSQLDIEERCWSSSNVDFLVFIIRKSGHLNLNVVFARLQTGKREVAALSARRGFCSTTILFGRRYRGAYDQST